MFGIDFFCRMSIVEEEEREMSKVDPVELITNETSLFWIAGLASEIWPVLIHRLDELNHEQRIAVEHYAKEAKENPQTGELSYGN